MSFSSQNLRELNPWADPWWNHIVSAAADEIERLNAENARLREALERISKLENVTVSDFDGTEWEHQRIARAALEQSEPKP